MPSITWNTALYDEKHSFVTRYGADLIGWLHPAKGERILDLGCGTGQLTREISAYGAELTGIDNSGAMIRKAKESYPEIDFECRDARNFQFEKPFQAIFSNAALHWIDEPEKVIKCMYRNLEEGGRIVLEFGGKGNVAAIISAIRDAMIISGFGEKLVADSWYFPSVGEYSSLLEKNGFRVTSAILFERPTPLSGEDGMESWIEMFGSFFFRNIAVAEKNIVIREAVHRLKKTNYRDQSWYADYHRIRIKAIK